MRRRSFLMGMAAGMAAGAQQTSRPNLLVLLTDDQRWDALGCMGNRIVRTPNIDRLAAQGVTFTNHFVTTSICMTSRASIFTGLYARTHGIWDFRKPFPEEAYARIYPELLRQAGYYGGFVGKWGIGGELPVSRFDYWRGFSGQGHYYQKQAGGGFVHLTEQMGDNAVEFLRGAPADRPFHLSVSFKAPHVQDEDPRQFLHDPAHEAWYRDVRIPSPPTAEPRYISALPRSVQRSEGRRRWAARFGTPELYQSSVKAYYRLITEVDAVVGRLVEELQRSGRAGNTVVLFSSDNGFYLGEHGLAGKWLMHEESIRTPLIVQDPRLPRKEWGTRREAMTLNIDLAPTLLDSAGIPMPQPVQGRSLRPLLNHASSPWRTEWFYEHHYPNNGWIPSTEGVRTARWKYTRYVDSEPEFEELFDLKGDPREEVNLASDSRHKGELERFRKRWRAWRASFESRDRNWREPD